MTLLLGVLAASLVGSVHCAAMCGGFVCLYAGLGESRRGRDVTSHIAYNGGASRFLRDPGARRRGDRRPPRSARRTREYPARSGDCRRIFDGALGAGDDRTSLGIKVPIGAAPDWAKRAIGGALVAMEDQPANVRAGALGLLTTLLPCGWLYTFVVTAGGTGNPVAGAAVMLAFWAGTVPMMLTMGLGVRRLARPLARHLPMASAVLVLALGVLSIAGKLRPLVVPGTTATHAMHGGTSHGDR